MKLWLINFIHFYPPSIYLTKKKSHKWIFIESAVITFRNNHVAWDRDMGELVILLKPLRDVGDISILELELDLMRSYIWGSKHLILYEPNQSAFENQSIKICLLKSCLIPWKSESKYVKNLEVLLSTFSRILTNHFTWAASHLYAQ